MNWLNFENKRILGTVPVEADGPAFFEVPSDRFVFFQTLDNDKRMIQSMRKPPVKLDGWLVEPARGFSFVDDVQPVFDRHYVSCHDFGNSRNGGLVLARDREVVFNAAYTELWSKRLTGAVGAGPAQVMLAGSWGSRASRLVAVLEGGHCDVRVGPEEMERIVTWVDFNAPYYPAYETAFPLGAVGRSPLTKSQSARIARLTGIDLSGNTAHDKHRVLINFDRPEVSPLLVALPADPANPARSEIIAILAAGAQTLRATQRGDSRQFIPCADDQARYLRRTSIVEDNRAAIRGGRSRYDNEPP